MAKYGINALVIGERIKQELKTRQNFSLARRATWLPSYQYI